jgi:hypothetical protein
MVRPARGGPSPTRPRSRVVGLTSATTLRDARAPAHPHDGAPVWPDAPRVLHQSRLALRVSTMPVAPVRLCLIASQA